MFTKAQQEGKYSWRNKKGFDWNQKSSKKKLAVEQAIPFSILKTVNERMNNNIIP